MADSRSLSRMPVYDIVKGRVVGRVHRLIVDADARKVVGLLLATRLGREPRCLPFRHVHAIGEHAVTVRGTEAIAPVSELPDMEEAMRAQRRIYNSPILTEGGLFIGDVDEFTINTQSGRLESLLVSGGLMKDLFRGQAALPSHLIVAIGEDATIVKDIAVSFLEQRQREQRRQESPGRAPSRPQSVSSRTIHGGSRASTSSPTKDRETGEPATWTERLRQALGVHGRRKTAPSGEGPVPDNAATPVAEAEIVEQPKSGLSRSEAADIEPTRPESRGAEASAPPATGTTKPPTTEAAIPGTETSAAAVPGSGMSAAVVSDTEMSEVATTEFGTSATRAPEDGNSGVGTSENRASEPQASATEPSGSRAPRSRFQGNDAREDW